MIVEAEKFNFIILSTSACSLSFSSPILTALPQSVACTSSALLFSPDTHLIWLLCPKMCSLCARISSPHSELSAQLSYVSPAALRSQ